MNTNLHIVITGGHHNSALVVARKLRDSNVRVTWLGHRRAAKGDQNDSAEFIEVKNAGIAFRELIAGKFTIRNGIKNLVNIPLGVIRSLKYLSALKPDAVLSFGGYMGFAVGLAAFLLGIPLYLHEQTVASGIGNQVLAKLSHKVYLTWGSSLGKFPLNKTEVVGLPLRDLVTISPAKKLFQNNLPTILIMGGKQGSHVINKLIFKHLPDLLTHYNLIHQTGMSSETGDYQQALARGGSLNSQLASRYLPQGYFSENEISLILNNIDLYLGRSGAHTTYELGILGIRSVLIPYLLTSGYEQLLNARVLEKAGLAIILPQGELTYPNLIKALDDAHGLKGKPLNLPVNAADRLVQSLISDLT